MVGDRHVFGLPFLRTPGRLCSPQCFFSPSLTPSRGDAGRGSFAGSSRIPRTFEKRIVKPLSDLRFSLDLFPDFFAIAAHNPSNPPDQATRSARRGGAREREVVEALNAAAFSARWQRSGAEESFEEVHDFGLPRQI